MNLQVLTIEQKQAIVALRPVLTARYQQLTRLLDDCTEQDIELWQIDLALNDLESVLAVMLPRIPDEDEPDEDE